MPANYLIIQFHPKNIKLMLLAFLNFLFCIDNRGTGFNPPSYSYPINDYPAGGMFIMYIGL